MRNKKRPGFFARLFISWVTIFLRVAAEHEAWITDEQRTALKRAAEIVEAVYA
jgi:hypothetical protein